MQHQPWLPVALKRNLQFAPIAKLGDFFLWFPICVAVVSNWGEIYWDETCLWICRYQFMIHVAG